MTKQDKKKQKNTDKKANHRKYWPLKVFILTFFIASFLSLGSSSLMEGFSITTSLVTLIVIIIIGVVFDIIGIAVTAASEVPFLSMASKKKRGAINAVRLIRKADQVSSFWNNVIGDICSIISGSAGSILIMRLSSNTIRWNPTMFAILVSSLIAAFTVGGKALGKSLAIRQSQNIVYYVGYLISLLRGELK